MRLTKKTKRLAKKRFAASARAVLTPASHKYRVSAYTPHEQAIREHYARGYDLHDHRLLDDRNAL